MPRRAPAPLRRPRGLAPAAGRRPRRAPALLHRPLRLAPAPARRPGARSPSGISAPRRLPRAPSSSVINAPPFSFLWLPLIAELRVLCILLKQVPANWKTPGGTKDKAKLKMAARGQAKGKDTVKEDPSFWKGPWCVLLQGEKAVPVSQYLSELSLDIISTAPGPGETVQSVAGMLIDPAKDVLFKIISMVFREIDADRCFSSLAHKNIYVNLDGLVKIKNGNVIRSATDKLVEENVHALGNLIDELVAAASRSYSDDRSINPELKHLIYLLKKYKAGKSRYLMQFHPCNVPDQNRGFYFIIVQDETIDVLRYNDPKVFHFVIDGVHIPGDMFTRMQQHTILKKYLARGKYDPAATKKTGLIPKLVPIKCLRNVPSHGREDAGASTGPFFTRGDLGRSVYDKAPLAICSMAKGLDAAGVLKTLGLESLFPGRLQFHKSR